MIARSAGPVRAKSARTREKLVPVERIELPTFGLQNRCSTAELNRQLIENPLYRFVPCNRCPTGGAPSNIRVGWQGLLARRFALDGHASLRMLVLAGLRRCRSPRFATNSQPSRVILGSMGIRPKHVEKAMRALRRRQPLLEAWLDALNRLDGPSCQIVRFRNTAQRRPLMQSAERHRAGRHRSHLLIVQTGPLLR
jgi:hypothetical protein